MSLSILILTQESVLRSKFCGKKIGIRRFRIWEKHLMSSLLHAIIRLWSSSAFMSMHMRWSHASQLVPSYWPRPSKWQKPARNSLLQFVCCNITIFLKATFIISVSGEFLLLIFFLNSSNCCTHKYDHLTSQFHGFLKIYFWAGFCYLAQFYDAAAAY